MNFIIDYASSLNEGNKAFWFLLKKSKLLLKRINDKITIPTSEEISSIINQLTNKHYIGSIDGLPCYTAKYPINQVLPQDMEFCDLRQLYGQIDESLFLAGGRGIQIIAWDETHKFCGSCGTPTETKVEEHAKVCPSCGLTCYPRLSPAVIVAVTKGNELLLARNKSFTVDFYSVIAGFVEPGETLEDCIKREIREEVGIEVKNINYFGSQPWPFPNSLMIAFTAEYDKGDLRIGENELLHADWFTVHNLPKIPNKISIARQLIDWYIEENK